MITSTVVLLHFCIKISNPKYILNNDYKFFAVYIYKNFCPDFFLSTRTSLILAFLCI